MRKIFNKALAFAVFTGVMAIAGAAEAQSWSEANTPGFFGGYGHFGGYYDTFGDYGGQTNYISATLNIYLDVYNIFVNLLSLLGIFGGSRD